jgi:hypothetical protein
LPSIFIAARIASTPTPLPLISLGPLRSGPTRARRCCGLSRSRRRCASSIRFSASRLRFSTSSSARAASSAAACARAMAASASIRFWAVSSVVDGEGLDRGHLVEEVLGGLALEQRVELVEVAALERGHRHRVDLDPELLLLQDRGLEGRPGGLDGGLQRLELGLALFEGVLGGVPLLGEGLGLVVDLLQLAGGVRRVAGRVLLCRGRRGGHEQRHGHHRDHRPDGGRRSAGPEGRARTRRGAPTRLHADGSPLATPRVRPIG